jgi:ribosome biogenesis protein ENP2
MHGYFMSLKLYDTARVIANPFAYAEHREKMIREKVEKMAGTRIRTKKDVGVKVNKTLAEKIMREEEKVKKRDRRKKQEEINEGKIDVDEEQEGGKAEKPSILNDPRFAMVFENPDFAIDENSREYALLNPSTTAQKRGGERAKTAVEDEEEESDKFSSDGLGDSTNESDVSDSSDAGGEYFSPRFYFPF